MDAGSEADAGEFPDAGPGPAKQFGVGCGCTSASDLSVFALASFLAQRLRRRQRS